MGKPYCGIVGCIFNFARLIITREISCIVINIYCYYCFLVLFFYHNNNMAEIAQLGER
jgi:hypothetical protein